jgi:hypothetical protein
MIWVGRGVAEGMGVNVAVGEAVGEAEGVSVLGGGVREGIRTGPVSTAEVGVEPGINAVWPGGGGSFTCWGAHETTRINQKTRTSSLTRERRTNGDYIAGLFIFLKSFQRIARRRLLKKDCLPVRDRKKRCPFQDGREPCVISMNKQILW